jgi:hypothetical protein
MVDRYEIDKKYNALTEKVVGPNLNPEEYPQYDTSDEEKEGNVSLFYLLLKF